MKCTDEVFADCAVDRGLATHAAVHLRQQGRRDLHERTAALHDMRCKTGDVADNAAAQSDDMVAAFHMLREHPVGQLFQLSPAFASLTRRQNIRCAFHASGG